MTITTAINAIQTINRTIAGVYLAPDADDYPTNLTTAKLPIVLTWTSSIDVEPFQDIINLTPNFIFAPIGQGAFNPITAGVLDMMEATRTKYRQYIESDPSVTLLLNDYPLIEVVSGQRIRMTGLLPNPESGSALQYPAMEYWGFKLDLQVRISGLGEAC